MKKLSLKIIVVSLLVVLLTLAGQKSTVWAQSAQFYSNRGVSYVLKGQYDRALADFNRALEINPRLAVA